MLGICSLFVHPTGYAAVAEFDWGVDNDAWSGGSLSGGGSDIDGTGVDVAVTLAPTAGVGWITGSPTVATGPVGQPAGSSSTLQIDVDTMAVAWGGANSTLVDHVLVKVTFDHYVSDVSFSIYDVDIGVFDGFGYSFVDSISDIKGFGTPTGGDVSPELISLGGAVKASPNNPQEEVGNIYYGTYATDNQPGPDGLGVTGTYNDGIISIDFGKNWISGFSFIYSGLTNDFEYESQQFNTDHQAIGLGDISFTPVPEVGTLSVMALVLLGVACSEVRRRLHSKQQR